MEIGHRANWSVTTAKPGNGVELMRDDQTSTYWQSDGHQPHLVDIKFDRKMHITVALPLSLVPFSPPSASGTASLFRFQTRRELHAEADFDSSRECLQRSQGGRCVGDGTGDVTGGV